MRDQIIIGDALQHLWHVPSESVQTCITSPPFYGLRDYGVKGQLGLEKHPEQYVQKLVETFAQVKRALKPDGTLWLNLGDSYTPDHPQKRSQPGKNWGKHKAVGGSRARDRRGPQGDRKGKDLTGIPWMVAFALRKDGWYLRSEIIWCLSGGTRVYAKTQKVEGPMMIKDLVKLDPSTIKLWNGVKWTQVLGWSETPRPSDPVEILLRSGERIGCTQNHEWPTQRGLTATQDLQIGDVIKTCRLPEPCHPTTPEHLPDDIGWFVGLYLAEGSRDDRGRLQFAGHVQETERHQRLAVIAAKYGGHCRRHMTSANGCVDVVSGLVVQAIVSTYIHGRCAKGKGLHPRCWARSNAFLKSLAEGYLEGDGHFNIPNNRWRLGFTRNYRLETDLRTLAARLGAKIKLSLSKAHIKEREYPSFKGEWRWIWGDHHNTKQPGEVIEIKPGRARKFWDIGVADEPYLFALASGVLTHNSKANPVPEGVKDRPTRSHETVFLLSRSPTYYYDWEAILEPSEDEETRNRRSVWTIRTKTYEGAHFAVWPEELPERCIKAATREGDLVMDPFAGSGTTLAVATELQRAYLGIELNPEYEDLIRERLRPAVEFRSERSGFDLAMGIG